MIHSLNDLPIHLFLQSTNTYSVLTMCQTLFRYKWGRAIQNSCSEEAYILMGIDWETIGIQINIYIICQEAINVKKFEIGQNDRNNGYW